MPKKKAAWTVMVYLAGDNNLTTECLFALNEMKKAAPGEHINVIAQFDPRDDHLRTHRYEINRNGDQSTLFDDIIDEARYNSETGEVRFVRESKNAILLSASRQKNWQIIKTVLSGSNDLTNLEFENEEITDDTDTGSPITLYNFLSFCIQEYPADHYIAVLSGHAGGTETDYLLKDESSKGSLTFNEMKLVFEKLRTDLKGEPIDIIGMDNCLMSMGEICYELKGVAKIIVGCESYSPASGWPYRPILERMREDFATPKNKGGRSLSTSVAKSIVEEYVSYYSTYWMAGLSVTQSAIDLTKVEKLKKVVDKLAIALESELKKEQKRNKDKRRKKKWSFQDSLLLAHWEAQSYNGESFVDLFDFCHCLENRVGSGLIAKKCREVKRFVSSEFVLKSCYSGAVYQYSYGISLYFPWAQVASNYDNLDFVRDSGGSGWSSFLHTYTSLTRREPRGIEGKSLRLSDPSVASLVDIRMGSERMGSERMGSERMGSERMGSERAGNPIHSMRNPPIVFLPGECIRNRTQVLRAQKRLLGKN
jgi:hypothetical protein